MDRDVKGIGHARAPSSRQWAQPPTPGATLPSAASAPGPPPAMPSSTCAVTPGDNGRASLPLCQSQSPRGPERKGGASPVPRHPSPVCYRKPVTGPAARKEGERGRETSPRGACSAGDKQQTFFPDPARSLHLSSSV